jgi:hypothetical protein
MRGRMIAAVLAVAAGTLATSSVAVAATWIR